MAGKGTPRGRRGNGDGSITQRKDGRWQGAVSLPGTGGTRRKTVYGETREEVRQKLTKLQRDLDRGLPIAQERQTVERYLTNWLATKKAMGDILPSSYQRYENDIRVHIVPALGRYTLAKVTASPYLVQDLYRALIEEKGLARSTVHKMHVLLHNALGEAMRRDLVTRNVCDLVTPPKLLQDKRPVWTPEQWHTFRARYAEEAQMPLYTLIINTCTRLGEVLALTWEDVDLDCATMLVHQGRTRDWDKHYTTGSPKTAAGTRTIHLTDDARDALRDQRRRQAELRLHAGEFWKDNDLVFANRVGMHLAHTHLEARWRQLMARHADLPAIHIHDLRHTGASMLLASGMNPLIVAQMLGHADPSITLRVYGHVMPNEGRLAAEAMQRAMDEGRKEGRA